MWLINHLKPCNLYNTCLNNIKLFQEKKIRSVWNEEEQQWCFSVVDVVGVLTDSVNPTDYPELAQERMKELYE